MRAECLVREILTSLYRPRSHLRHLTTWSESDSRSARFAAVSEDTDVALVCGDASGTAK